MQRYPIARDSWSYLVILGILTIFVYIWFPYAALIPLCLFFFVAFFFRNPKRSIPNQPGVVVAPADGLVMRIDEVTENHFLKSEAIRITIFLNIFNVHINRTPIAGVVKYQKYQEGKFLAAYKPEAGQVNEQNIIGIQDGEFKVLVKQIAGLVARRIVTWVKPGDTLAKGDRIGLIKFGSCTEVYLPKDTQVKIEIQTGARVKAGETILGRVI